MKISESYIVTMNKPNNWFRSPICFPFLTYWMGVLVMLGVANLVSAGNLYVPNGSFESQVLEVGPEADNWQISPQASYWDTNNGPWQQLTGLFENVPATNSDHINNADGNQLGYLFANPGVAIFQDNNSTDWSNGLPTHAFNAVYQAGKSYTLTVGLTTSTEEPLTPGSPLQLSLYYRDASNNMVTVGATTAIYDTNIFTNLDNLIDYTVVVPGVKASDPWAGKNIGIQFASEVDFGNFGGVWDMDNVRLEEFVATALKKPGSTNGHFGFTLQSEPGSHLGILAANSLNPPGTNWTSLVTVTNTTGTVSFVDTNTNLNERFYRAVQLP